MLAVITGASSGVGATFARKLARRGFDMLLIARREDRLRAIAGELRDQHKVAADYLPADLTKPADRETVAARLRQASDLGILVNNAGFGTLGYFFESELADQENMHRLHVMATLVLTHAALENLVPRGVAGTGVINVSSVAAFGASPQNVSYCATKTWMNMFTEGLALELAAQDSPVTVQALCPGYTLSEFHDVVKVDRSRIPSSWWMTADSVVEESLRGFERRKAIVIPGWRYKLVVAAAKLAPAGLQRSVSTAMARRFKRQRDAR